LENVLSRISSSTLTVWNGRGVDTAEVWVFVRRWAILNTNGGRENVLVLRLGCIFDIKGPVNERIILDGVIDTTESSVSILWSDQFLWVTLGNVVEAHSC